MVADDGLVILPMLLARHAAHLEYVDKVGIDQHFDGEVHRREVVVLKAHAVEENLRGQQLLAANVDGIFGKVEGVAQGDVAGGQLDLRGKRFFRGRRKHHGAMPADTQFEMAEKAGVVVEEANVGRARRIDVPETVVALKVLPSMRVRLSTLRGSSEWKASRGSRWGDGISTRSS